MKKIVSILLTVALLLSLSVSAFADTAEATVTVGSAEAQVGDEVTLEVSISATNYATYGLNIVYDAEALELTAITEGDAVVGMFFGNVSTGMVTDMGFRNADVEGVLFTLTFTVLAEGEHTVSLNVDGFNKADQTEVPVAVVDGVISVAGEPTIEDGVYYISYGDLTFAALNESYNYGYPYAGDVNNLAETDYITITNVGDGQFTMQDCYGRYIYMKGTYNSFNVGTELPEEGHLWVLEAAEGGYYIKNVLKEKYIAYSEQYTSWGAYETISETSVLAITPVVEEEPEVIYEGELVVETTDTYCYSECYTMVAPVTGTYTFYIPAGLGVWEKASFESGSWSSNPIIDFYANEEGFEYVVDLTEGDEFSFYVGAITKQEWTITYTVVASEGGEGGDDPIEDTYTYQDLVIGNNNVNAADIHWMYTASTAGTLTLNAGVAMGGDITVTVTVNEGEAQALAPMTQLVLELQAGDVVKVNVFTTSAYMTITAEWAGEGGEDPENPEDPTEPDGTEANPFIIEELPYNGTQEETDDFYYQWTATEDGTLYVYTEGGCSMVGSSVGGWKYTDGGKYIEVAAGDVIVINIWNTTEFTVEFVPAGEEECEHNYVVTETVEATCTEDGHITYTCEYCGDSYTEVIEATGHNYGITDTVEATCTEDGYYVYTCEHCGDSYTEVFEEATGHNHVVTETVEATCTEDGHITYTCECGDSYTEVIEATGHTFVDGVCHCGEAEPVEPNPPTGNMNILAIALIAAMSVTAVVVTAKKSDEE